MNAHDLVSLKLESQGPLILSDEQFSCLLGSGSNSAHPQPALTFPDGVATPDKRSLLFPSLADQLLATQERLRSNAQAQAKAVQSVSNAMLKRDRIDNAQQLVRQLSLHAVDHLSIDTLETIPAVVVDLLQMDTMTDAVYASIEKSHDIAHLLASGRVTRTVIDSIQQHQLTLAQIQLIQTQFLTPTLTRKIQR